jgi:hypothetical protein
MILNNTIHLREIVPPEAVQEWKDQHPTRVLVIDDVPPKVLQFIDAFVKELGELSRTGQYTTMITGHELLLANISYIGKEKVKPSTLYPLDVPIMQRVDHRANMIRMYKRKGETGLVDFCRANTDPSVHTRLISILKKHVFV